MTVVPACVVTAAGQARRLGPIGTVIPKPLLPISSPRHGRSDTPLERIVASIRRAGIDEIVIASDGHPWIEEMAETWGARAIVVEPTGEFDAVGAVVDHLGRGNDLVVVSGDNIFPAAGLDDFLTVTRSGPTDTMLLAAATVSDIRRFTDVVVTTDDRFPHPRVVSLFEKPSRQGGGLAKAGLYRLPRHVVELIAAGPAPRDRYGEGSMTAAIEQAMTWMPCLAYRLPGGFIDIGTRDGLADAIGLSRADEKVKEHA